MKVSLSEIKLPWRSENTEEKSKIVEFVDGTSIDEIERSENIQLVVAAALVSAYFTTAAGTESPFQGAENHLKILATISITFLVLKLATVSIRPYSDSILLEITDFLFLPFIYMVSLLAGSIVIFSQIISINISSLLPLSVSAETGIKTVAIGIASSIYSLMVSRKMGILESKIPEHTLTVTSGSSGSTLPLTLQNDMDNILSPDDIKLLVDSPELVDVEVEPAIELAEDVWKPIVPIKPGKQSQVDVRFLRSSKKDEITEEKVKITVLYEGDEIETHLVNLRI